jgi:hypothetical protein
MNYCLGDFGSSTELTEINPRLLKDESMGAILESTKDFLVNNSQLIVGISILALGLWGMSEDKKAKR